MKNPDIDSKQRDLLNRAIEALNDCAYEDFSNLILELYSQHVTCNCFLNFVAKETWKNGYESVVQIEAEESDFCLWFSKAFLANRIEDYENAYTWYSKTISLQPENAVLYSLRSGVDLKPNPTEIDDAKEAALLDPSARNYFVLAGSYEDSEISSAIIFYKKTLSLDPTFTCAYNNIGLRYKKLGQYDDAAKYFRKCIECDPEHWCYYNLWSCLDILDEHEDAIAIASKGLELFPTDSDYIFALGVSNFNFKRYRESIRYFSKYLNEFPDDDNAKNNLHHAQSKFESHLIEVARSHVKSDEFKSKPFNVRFNELKGHTIQIQFEERRLLILDSKAVVLHIVKFSKSIKDPFTIEDLLNPNTKTSKKAYFVYPDLLLRYSWLWSCDVIRLEELL